MLLAGVKDKEREKRGEVGDIYGDGVGLGRGHERIEMTGLAPEARDVKIKKTQPQGV